MFKLVLFFKLNRTSIRYLNSTPFLLLFLFKLILKDNITLSLNKQILRIKTLMLSPFHYKVAKKNLCTNKIIFKCTLNFSSLLKHEALVFIFFSKFNLTFNITNLSILKSNLIFYNKCVFNV